MISTTAYASSADPTPPSENEALTIAFDPFDAQRSITLVLCPDKELNEMLFFFQISALKILALATAMPAFFALIFEKNNYHYNLSYYLDRVLDHVN